MRKLSGALCLAVLVLGACNKPAPTNAPPPAANAAVNTAVNTAAPTAGATSQDAADAKAFLEGLYAHYKTAKNNNFNMFDTKSTAVFDPSMIQLLDEDNKLLKGDLGAIDGDYLCNCQDFVSLKATITVQSATPTTAEATSDYIDTGMQDQGVRHDVFDLVKVDGAWRIHDITDPSDPSSGGLRKTLTDEIASLKSGKNADVAP